MSRVGIALLMAMAVFCALLGVTLERLSHDQQDRYTGTDARRDLGEIRHRLDVLEQRH